MKKKSDISDVNVSRKKILYIFPLLTAFIFAALAFIQPAFFKTADYKFEDFFSNNVILKKPSEKIVLILGSDVDIESLGGWPVSRSTHAELIEKRLLNARTIGLDILFVEAAKSAADDDALAAAMENHGNVVMVSSFADSTDYIYPIKKLEEKASAVGFVNSSVDSDNIARKVDLIKQIDGNNLYPSFLTAIMMSSGYDAVNIDNKNNIITFKSPDGKILDLKNPFRRVPYNDIEIYSYKQVLDGKVSEDVFDDAIVFIGASVTGAPDVIYASDGLVNGTKFWVDTFACAVNGFSPVRISNSVQAALVLLYLTAACFVMVRLSLKNNWVIPVGFALVWIGITFLLFSLGLCYIKAVYTVFGLIAVYVAMIVCTAFVMRKDLRIRSMPINLLFDLTRNMLNVNADSSFEEVIAQNKDEIKKSFGADIVKSIATQKDSVLTDLFNIVEKENKKVDGITVLSTRIIAKYKAVIIIPLPDFADMDKTKKYTLVGCSKLPDMSTAHSIAALIISTYIYFVAAKDSAQKQQMYFTIISMIISIIDAKDPVTSGHSQRVAELSEKIAIWMGLEPEVCKDVRFSAIVHDIGKLAIPDSVLHKASIFTKGDFDVMKSHTVRGAEIVENAGFSDAIISGVLQHHERLDGKGYPYSAVSNDISLYARIIKVADVFDALVSNRQYKKAWDVKKAIDILNSGKGTEFDPDIVDTFLKNSEFGDPAAFSGDEADEEKKYFQEKGIEFALEFVNNIMGKYDEVNINSVINSSSDFNFGDTRAFNRLDWGECYGIDAILSELPFIINYDCETKSLTTLNRYNEKELIEGIGYYFFKGFLNSGAVITDIKRAQFIKSELVSALGEPSEISKDILMWDKFNAIIYQIFTENKIYTVYVTKYLLSNK